MGNYENYVVPEAIRLNQIMANDPHFAADELRSQLQQIDPRTASQLISETKSREYYGGAGDLQIQVEMTPDGCDSGFRNVTMATPDGIEQIAEIQTGAGSCPNQGGYDNGYNVDPLAAAASIIVGDLLWQRQRGGDFNDPRYGDWRQREQWRENDWQQNNGDFRRQWQDRDYRQSFQQGDWRQNAWSPDNSYASSPRIDTSRHLPVDVNPTIPQVGHDFRPRVGILPVPAGSQTRQDYNPGKQEVRPFVQQPQQFQPQTAPHVAPHSQFESQQSQQRPAVDQQHQQQLHHQYEPRQTPQRFPAEQVHPQQQHQQFVPVQAPPRQPVEQAHPQPQQQQPHPMVPPPPHK